jgi:hypothetical protein
MTDSPEDQRSRSTRRLWCGSLGLFIGSILGLITSSIVHGYAVEATVGGAVAGFLLGLLFGLDAIDVALQLWTG